MTLAGWLKVVDALGGFSQVSKWVKAAGGRPEETIAPGGGALGQIEARLAGVVVAALKEAFDRDSARLELERSRAETERRRAEEALRLELLRQAGDRALAEARLIAIVAVVVWVVSAVFVTRLTAAPNPAAQGVSLAGLDRAVLAAGWAALVAALACTLLVTANITSFLGGLGTAVASRSNPLDLPRPLPALAARWLLVAGLALTAASFLLWI